MTDTPVLYSFRRCPYCMRAHMALKYSGLEIELREVELNNMPAEALAVSPQATVPLLILDAQHSLNESWDIVKWAIAQNDPQNWAGENGRYLAEAEMLIETNDFSFKPDLDHYKYADRYPEHPAEYYRQQGEEFLQELDEMLAAQRFLLSEQLTVADIGIAPFIRQFSMVDPAWFAQAPYPHLRQWLSTMLANPLFQHALRKRPVWKPGDTPLYLQDTP